MQHFATQHWASQHWATQHYVGIGVVVADIEFGGHQFLVFQPILQPLTEEMQVGKNALPYLQKSETEIEIDGKDYKFVAQKSPSEIIKAAPDINRILDSAAKKLGITRRKAKKELYNQIIKELKKVESVKESVFNDDEEIIMILVATDDI